MIPGLVEPCTLGADVRGAGLNEPFTVGLFAAGALVVDGAVVELGADELGLVLVDPRTVG